MYTSYSNLLSDAGLDWLWIGYGLIRMMFDPQAI
jgi:hypothetical protein